jgi:hypothetical protein
MEERYHETTQNRFYPYMSNVKKMMEERYHATTQNRFYSDMSNVIKNDGREIP